MPQTPILNTEKERVEQATLQLREVLRDRLSLAVKLMPERPDPPVKIATPSAAAILCPPFVFHISRMPVPIGNLRDPSASRSLTPARSIFNRVREHSSDKRKPSPPADE